MPFSIICTRVAYSLASPTSTPPSNVLLSWLTTIFCRSAADRASTGSSTPRRAAVRIAKRGHIHPEQLQFGAHIRASKGFSSPARAAATRAI
jgi:hypothetical protein